MSAANQSNMQSCTFSPKCFCPFGMPRSSNGVQATPLRIGNQYTETGNSGFKRSLCQQCLNKHARVRTPSASPSSAQTAPCVSLSRPFRTLSLLVLAWWESNHRAPAGVPPPMVAFCFKSTGFSGGKATGNWNCSNQI